MVGPILSDPRDVVRALVTYTDWWQPPTTSILQAKSSRKGSEVGIGAGLDERVEERVELCRRMAWLDDRGRRLLHLWYVAQRTPLEIAREVGVSRRHTHRLRAKYVRELVDLGEPHAA